MEKRTEQEESQREQANVISMLSSTKTERGIVQEKPHADEIGEGTELTILQTRQT